MCLRYSQEQLYAVVAGVEHYKEFVPWCQRSDIVDRKPPGFVEAELEVGFKMFVERSVMVLSSLACGWNLQSKMIERATSRMISFRVAGQL